MPLALVRLCPWASIGLLLPALFLSALDQKTPASGSERVLSNNKQQALKKKRAAAAKLPELPPNVAARLKRISTSRQFVVAMPKASLRPIASDEVKSTTVMPIVTTPPTAAPTQPGVIFAIACIHSTTYNVQAAYPVLVCHPLVDDIRITGTPEALERVAPSGKASASQVKSVPIEPENSFRVSKSALGFLVCSYARMPVLVDILKTQKLCGSPSRFDYSTNIAGVPLAWQGDPEQRPANFEEFGALRCIGDIPISCSGASKCLPLCGQ